MNPFKPSYPYLYLFVVLCLLMPYRGKAQTTEYKQLKKQLTLETDSFKYVDLLNQISFLAQMKCPDSCLFYSLKAKTIANRLDYAKGKGDALSNMATVFRQKGVHQQALFFYERALLHYQNIGNLEAQAQVLLSSAKIYSDLNDTIPERNFVRQAAQISQKLPKDSLLGKFFADYVGINDQLSRDSVNHYLNRAAQIGVKYNNQYLLMHIQQIWAEKLLVTGKTQEALPHLQHYLDIAEKNHWEYYLLQGLILKGKYQINSRQLDQAIQTYDRVVKAAQENEFKLLETEALRSLLQLYQQKGSSKLIISTQQALVKSLEQASLRNNTILGDFSAFMISSQMQKNLKNQGMLYQQRINALLLIIILITLFLAITFFLYQKSKKNSKRLSELNQTVNAQNRALLDADDFKGKLISMLAHDFRAPIGSTLSIISLLKQGEKIPAAQLEQFYGRIELDLNHVLTAFDHTLSWIRTQMPGYIFDPKQLQAQNIMQQSVLLMLPAAGKKGLQINNLIQPDLLVDSDAEILHFINRNLLNNAIKFSPLNGSIHISLELTTTEAIISIQDEGPGINGNDLDEIFIFDPVRKSIDKGAGLALSISYEMIEKVKGRIWAEQLTQGGTVFKYAIPLSE